MALDLDLFDFSPDAFVTDGAVPAQIEQAEATAADNARRRALELQAQACNNAADACWYLARSLGAARDLPPGEASMELLFQLIGALADLPAEIASAALPKWSAAATTASPSSATNLKPRVSRPRMR